MLMSYSSPDFTGNVGSTSPRHHRMAAFLCANFSQSGHLQRKEEHGKMQPRVNWT
jgi:hypothetical protein